MKTAFPKYAPILSALLLVLMPAVLIVAGCGGSGNGGNTTSARNGGNTTSGNNSGNTTSGNNSGNTTSGNNSGTATRTITIPFEWPAQSVATTGGQSRVIPRLARYLRVRVLQSVPDPLAPGTEKLEPIREVTRQRPESAAAIQDSVTLEAIPYGRFQFIAEAFDGLPGNSTLMAMAAPTVVVGSELFINNSTTPASVLEIALQSTITNVEVFPFGSSTAVSAPSGVVLDVGEAQNFTISAKDGAGRIVLVDPAEVRVFTNPANFVGVTPALSGVGFTLTGLRSGTGTGTSGAQSGTFAVDIYGGTNVAPFPKVENLPITVRTRIAFDDLRVGLETINGARTVIEGRSPGDRISFTLRTDNGQGGEQPQANITVLPDAVTGFELFNQRNVSLVAPMTNVVRSGDTVTFIPNTQADFVLTLTLPDGVTTRTLTVRATNGVLQIEGPTNLLQGQSAEYGAVINGVAVPGATFEISPALSPPLPATNPTSFPAQIFAPTATDVRVDPPALPTDAPPTDPNVGKARVPGRTYRLTANLNTVTSSLTAGANIVVAERTAQIVPFRLSRRVEQLQLNLTGIVAPTSVTWSVVSGDGAFINNSGLYDLGSYVVVPDTSRNYKTIRIKATYMVSGVTLSHTQDIRAYVGGISGTVQ